MKVSLGLAAGLLGASLLSCVTLQITETPNLDPPVPVAFRGDEPPKLIATEVEGLLAAPGVDPTLYYYEPHERWYRFRFRRWYEAFSWDGNWFPPENIPDVLLAKFARNAPEEPGTSEETPTSETTSERSP